MIGLNVNIIIDIVVLAMTLVAVVITFGVIWRTRNGLDTCHKFLLVAIVMFGIRMLLEILEELQILFLGIWLKIPEVLFVIFFVLGLYKIRSILRKINGEIR